LPSSVLTYNLLSGDNATSLSASLLCAYLQVEAYSSYAKLAFLRSFIVRRYSIAIKDGSTAPDIDDIPIKLYTLADIAFLSIGKAFVFSNIYNISFAVTSSLLSLSLLLDLEELEEIESKMPLEPPLVLALPVLVKTG